MNKIQVKILDHNLDGTSLFLAKLTQRGHEMKNMHDVNKLYEDCKIKKPSKELMSLPHSTIRRMNYLTVAIWGLSTKALSQLRTHATRMTFVSTSTQYSEYSKVQDPYVTPEIDRYSPAQQQIIKEAYEKIHREYRDLINIGIDKDLAGYLLPQGLRKVLIMSGNLDAWQYVMNIRLCKRNTIETRYIMEMIREHIKEECGPEYVIGMAPNCQLQSGCREGKFSCLKEEK